VLYGITGGGKKGSDGARGKEESKSTVQLFSMRLRSGWICTDWFKVLLSVLEEKAEVGNWTLWYLTWWDTESIARGWNN